MLLAVNSAQKFRIQGGRFARGRGGKTEYNIVRWDRGKGGGKYPGVVTCGKEFQAVTGAMSDWGGVGNLGVSIGGTCFSGHYPLTGVFFVFLRDPRTGRLFA